MIADCMSAGPPAKLARRIFVASPADLSIERRAIVDSVQRLAQGAPGDPVEVFAYEREDHLWNPGSRWQPQIPRPGRDGYDILLCLFGERVGKPLAFDGPLGFEIPEAIDYGSIGTGCPLTGTLFEFFEGLDAHRRQGAPRLLLYLKGDQTVLDHWRQHDQRNWGGCAHYRQLERDALARGHRIVPRDVSDDYWQQVKWLSAFVDSHAATNPVNRLFLEQAEFTKYLETDLRTLLGIRQQMTRGLGKGLRPFDLADKDILFGRNDDVRRLVGVLHSAAAEGRVSLLVLYGKSGCGKSSTIRAGIAARLADGSFFRSIGREFVPIVANPAELGGDPFESLWNELGRRCPGLSATPGDDAIDQLRQVLGERRLFVAIDQFEEVLALHAQDATRWDSVVEFLFQIPVHDLGYTAVALKDDWLSKWREHPAVKRLVTIHRVCEDEFSDRLEKGTIFDIVQRTCHGGGFAVSTGLLEHLWQELRHLEGRSEAVLPLVSLALERLQSEWETRSVNAPLGLSRVFDDSFCPVVTLGSLINAVGEQAFEKSGAAPELVGHILRSLVTVAIDGPVRRRSLATPVSSDFNPEDQPLLASLAEHRLLLASEGAVRLTHEAVLEHWERARTWWGKEQRYVELRSALGAILHTGARLPRGLLDEAVRMATDWRGEPGMDPQSPLSQFVQEHLRDYFDVSRPYSTDGEPRLTDAVRLRNVELVSHLLDVGADVNVTSAREGALGTTPLVVAAANGYATLVTLLLDRGAEIDAENAQGQTALRAAMIYGQRQTAQLLLERGADPDRQSAADGGTPLMVAAWRGDLEMSSTLLEAGADPNRLSPAGPTALALALEQRHLAVAKLLLDRDAAIDIAGHSQWDVIALAVEHGDEDILRKLAAKRVDFALPTRRGLPLAIAARSGRTSIVELLVSGYGVGVDVWDASGHPALGEAMAAHHPEIVRLLIDAGATLPLWHERDAEDGIRHLTPDAVQQRLSQSILAAVGRSWPLPPLIDGEWDVLAPEVAAAFLAERFLSPPLDSNAAGLVEILGARRLAVPFYDDAHLYEVWARHADGGSGYLTFIQHPIGTWLLDGRSAPIHEMNARFPLRVETKQQAISYLKYFCAGIIGREKGENSLGSMPSTFVILDDAARLLWLDDVPASTKEAAALVIQKAFFRLDEETRTWRSVVSIRYANALFTANFELAPTGMVTMTSDEPRVAELPLHCEAFVRGLRRLTDPVVYRMTTARWFEFLSPGKRVSELLRRLVERHGARWNWDITALEVWSLFLSAGEVSLADVAATVGATKVELALEQLERASWLARTHDGSESIWVMRADNGREMQETMAVLARAEGRTVAENLRQLVRDVRLLLKGHTTVAHWRVVSELYAAPLDDEDLVALFPASDSGFIKECVEELVNAKVTVRD
jgi:ankyrin repeat protein